jgi:DNA polymerase III alpha subunit
MLVSLAKWAGGLVPYVMRKTTPPSAPANYSHLVLLARNRVGYKNLIRLSSIGYVEGYHRRPRVDKEVLAEHREGIVCLAACLSGEIALWLRQGNYDEARRSAEWFAGNFGPDGFWLEVQNHGLPDEKIVTEGMLRLGTELGIPVVATNDAHYLRREDAEAHEDERSYFQLEAFVALTGRHFFRGVSSAILSRVPGASGTFENLSAQSGPA